MVTLVTDSHTGRAIVNVHGELDVYSAPSLKSALDSLADTQLNKLTIDMADVTFLDSSGVSVLVREQARATSLGRELTLVISHPRVLKILAVTHLDETFHIESSLAD